MTEFEAATIAFQQASLGIQQQQLWAALAIPAVAALVGIGQCLLIWIGIRAMRDASEARAVREDKRHEETMKALNDSHAATMAALRELITRTGLTSRPI